MAKIKSLKKPKCGMRNFYLERLEDVSGTSGTGVICEGTEFSHGQCVVSWLTKYTSIAIYPTMKELINIHGHDDRTVVKYYE